MADDDDERRGSNLASSISKHIIPEATKPALNVNTFEQLMSPRASTMCAKIT